MINIAILLCWQRLNSWCFKILLLAILHKVDLLITTGCIYTDSRSLLILKLSLECTFTPVISSNSENFVDNNVILLINFWTEETCLYHLRGSSKESLIFTGINVPWTCSAWPFPRDTPFVIVICSIFSCSLYVLKSLGIKAASLSAIIRHGLPKTDWRNWTLSIASFVDVVWTG